MKPKYETHDNQLFMMLEKPERIDERLVIGYPVVDGSAEWALYQMMQGESISIIGQPNRAINLQGDKLHDSEKGAYWNGKSPLDFLSYARKTGWQLYRPEPELH